MTIRTARSLLQRLADSVHILLFCLLLVTVCLGSMHYSSPVATPPKATQNSLQSYNLPTSPTKGADSANANSSTSTSSNSSSSPYEAQNESQQSTSSAGSSDTTGSMPAPSAAAPPTSSCTQCAAQTACTYNCSAQIPPSTIAPPACGGCGGTYPRPNPHQLCPMYCTM